MYHKLLKVALFGIGEEAASAMRAAVPPERFEFEFASAEVPGVELAKSSSVTVVALAALGGVGLSELSEAARSGIGFNELVVVASPEELAGWGETDYALADAIWPAPLNAACAAYEFAGLAKRAKAHAELYITNAYLNTIIDSMPAMVWFKALDGEHVKVNEYFCGIVDKTRDDVEGQFHNYIWSVPPEDWENAELTCKESDNAAIAAGKTVRCDENVSTHGEIRLFDTYKTPVFDEDGSTLGTTGFASDITLERELEELAWLNARTDYLTGLYNRRYFYEFLEEHADEGPMTFILVDLDNFKNINDDSGHSEGDNALLVTTAALHKSFPECPIVRWGGDEFIVVVPSTQASLAEDGNLDEFQTMLKEWTGEQCPIALTASIGVALQEGDDSVDHTVWKADDALYQAKAAGKACHRRYA